ncbi:MAG: PHP domain-containing protein [Candidatus Gastranaerophilales bacterium]|nr:PHP domain-containing protein [Candidatus Gastranaerophilales bacterium]
MKDFLANIKKEDFFNTVDLHIHTDCSDGENTPQQVADACKEKGFKIIAITDHNVVAAHNQVQSDDEIQIIKSVEFDCWHGYVYMHILGYGIDVNHPELIKLYAKNKLCATNDIIRLINYRSAKAVIKAIKAAGGIAVLAHPACCWSLNLKNTVKKLITYGLDGLETNYAYRRHRSIIKFYEASDVEKIAQELNLLQTGGSDSHSVEAIIKKGEISENECNLKR